MTVLIVTWSKTYQTHRDAARVHVRMPVSNLLLRDGTLYFLVVLVLNVTEMIVFRTEGQIFLVSFICSCVSSTPWRDAETHSSPPA
ncbi:hypothetical protein PHLGIDRAFT_230952 [Phlebiopsis gigantea 11061_1 CR5-6]|uniref:Uncharacterized protein n=1 Tax=Phlebiopsis gigantea (strain 11061_1 CR5-6) TaxID=745531 RepID=A0A0C3NYE6_PHLG1|nr:hypothetical protein PHLGIDRAFT_230952 [Phlebiopsis gigantea 11061_1 CR5-6]